MCVSYPIVNIGSGNNDSWFALRYNLPYVDSGSLKGIFSDHINSIVDEHKASYDGENIRDFIDEYLRVKSESNQPSFTVSISIWYNNVANNFVSVNPPENLSTVFSNTFVYARWKLM